MAYEILTIGALKAAIANLDDDTPVVLCQGSDAGPGALMEVANGAYFEKALPEGPEGELQKEELLADGLDYLVRDSLVLTSGYLTDRSKDPVRNE